MSDSCGNPAMRYLTLVRERLECVRKDLSHLIDLGQRMAEPILAGGSMWAPPVAPFWSGEFCSRAGGLMGLQQRHYTAHSANDVAYFALPRNAEWDPKTDQKLRRIMDSPARLFVVGSEDQLAKLGSTMRFAGFTGGPPSDLGLYARGKFAPLAPLWPIEMFVRGWLTAGEMIAACTRAGRMPVIWMSVWLEGALGRNASLFDHHTLAEPWVSPMFHDGRYIPALEPGRVAGEFLYELDRILDGLEAQVEQLAVAGQWTAEALEAQRRVHVILVGHSYPRILEIVHGRDWDPGATIDPEYPLDWSFSNSNLPDAVPEKLGAGDVSIHLGYAPGRVDAVQAVLSRGPRFIYTCPYGRPPGMIDHENLLWLDLPWRPGDATVDVPGYGVRILPMSSSAQSAAYFAILCEAAERLGWK